MGKRAIKKPAPASPIAPAVATAEARKRVRETVVIFPPVKIFNQDGSVLIKPGRPLVLGDGDEIGTAEAAKILGCTADHVSRLCDFGKLKEGTDWRRIGERGNYRIRRIAVLKLRTDLVVP